MKKITFRIFLFFITISCSAQQENIIIEGKIVDLISKEPLQFANIGVKGNRLGTISNQNGEFILKVPLYEVSKNIIVSYLGYKSKEINIENNQDIYLNIELEISPYVLKPVTVKFIKPTEIIIKSLQNIPLNYHNEPAILQAFYREEVAENKEKIQFIEAILEIYKSAYNDKKDKDQIQLLKGREQEGLKESLLFNYLFFVNGPYEALHQDVAKYSGNFIEVLQSTINFLNPKHFKYFDYQLSESEDENRPIYIINFKPSKNLAMLEGILIIDKQTYAFLSIEYKLSNEKKNDAQLIKYKSEEYINTQGFYTKANDYVCKANFKKYKGKYIFSSATINYSFFFINRNSMESFEISNSIALVVTSIETESVKPFNQKDNLWKHASLSKQLGKYDPVFWENYNVIKNEQFDEFNK